jgi:polyprenyl-phospho-N-acetylgalactosaminyl synthase
MTDSKIFIVVAAWNEQKRIKQVLKNLLDFGYFVIVINDGSTDQTEEEILKIKNEKLFYLKHQLNRGQGASLQTGNVFAQSKNADIVVHFDGDGQFLPEEIMPSIQPIIQEGFNFVIGSRFLQKNNGMPFLKKKIIHPVSRIINFFLTGVLLSDAHCGFRAFDRLSLKEIKIIQDGMSHNSEIIAKVKKSKLKFKEVPITVIYHEFGQGIGGGFKILKELFLSKISQ